MRSSRSRMPTRLRPNGERTSTRAQGERGGEEREHQVEEVEIVRKVDAERPAAPGMLMPLSPPVSEFQR